MLGEPFNNLHPKTGFEEKKSMLDPLWRVHRDNNSAKPGFGYRFSA